MPIPAVGAVLIRDNHVLLVKRLKPPAAQLWAIPGGKIQFGETIYHAAERELREETGINAQALEVIYHVDLIDSETSPPAFHFVIIDVLMRYVDGVAVAASDAQAVAWFNLSNLPYDSVESNTAAFLLSLRNKLPDRD